MAMPSPGITTTEHHESAVDRAFGSQPGLGHEALDRAQRFGGPGTLVVDDGPGNWVFASGLEPGLVDRGHKQVMLQPRSDDPNVPRRQVNVDLGDAGHLGQFGDNQSQVSSLARKKSRTRCTDASLRCSVTIEWSVFFVEGSSMAMNASPSSCRNVSNRSPTNRSPV